MAFMSSGNAVVDMMGSVSITGNIISMWWFKRILKENGRPNLLAIVILSDLIYWYRPWEMRDVSTGHVIGYKKKFDEDKLYKTYQEYADLLGEPKSAVKNAFDLLVEYGLVEREFRNVERGKIKLFNLMYLSLNVEKIVEFSKPVDDKKPGDPTCGRIVHKLNENEPEATGTECLTGGTQEISYTSPRKIGVGEKSDVPPVENLPTSLEMIGEVMEKTEVPPSEKSGTNTEITTETTPEITTENTSSSSYKPDIRTCEAKTVDDEMRNIFSGFKMQDRDIGCIVSASGNDLSKCRKAVEVLKHQITPVKNVVGWLIHAVREGYSMTERQCYSQETGKPQGSFFNFQQRNDYDFDALMKRLVVN